VRISARSYHIMMKGGTEYYTMTISKSKLNRNINTVSIFQTASRLLGFLFSFEIPCLRAYSGMIIRSVYDIIVIGSVNFLSFILMSVVR